MNNDEQKMRQDFLNEIANYQYIRDDGRLLLEPFCVYLSHCFGFDGILEKSPHPNAMYELLVELVYEKFDDEMAKRYIQIRPIVDWTPDMEFIYPDRLMTYVHISALVHVSHEWIYHIGHSLMQIPESQQTSKYFDWVKEEWIAVHGFINGYHNAFSIFQKEIDRRGIRDKGFSLFEALHLSRNRDIDFDAAKDILRSRHDSYQAALTRVGQSINDGYFLEAITLEECLISNCLFNYLSNTGTKLDNPSFKQLLTAIRKSIIGYDGLAISLFKEIDVWRMARNKAIHGFITATNDTLNQPRESFNRLTEATAKEGKILCESVVSWYELECVNFIPHQFPSRVAVH